MAWFERFERNRRWAVSGETKEVYEASSVIHYDNINILSLFLVID